jgi:DNA-directed RNA polymerase subunit beta'
MSISKQYYSLDENGGISNSDPCSNIVLNTFNLNWHFLHHNYHHSYCDERPTRISLGQFLCENVCIAKERPHLKSSQIRIVQVDVVVIRSAKPSLATSGAFTNILIVGPISKGSWCRRRL